MTPDPADTPTLRAELTEDESRRLALYFDTAGNPTIGVGHNLRDRGISDRVCDAMLADDIATAIGDLDAHAGWWRRLPEAQGRVLVNLAFNMGWPRLSGFHRFLAAMQAGDWSTAAAELRDSVWWHEVGTRGPRMVARLTGGAAAPSTTKDPT